MAKRDDMTVSSWFAGRDAELVARRADVWALLGWYHETQVKPYLTVWGALKRVWWRVTGETNRLKSPWELIHARIEEVKATRKAERTVQHELAKEPEPMGLVAQSNGNGKGARRAI